MSVEACLNELPSYKQEEGWPKAGVVWSSDSRALSWFLLLDPD